jgi:hypothetical protein
VFLLNPIAINTNESNMIKQPAQHPTETAIEPEIKGHAVGLVRRYRQDIHFMRGCTDHLQQID